MPKITSSFYILQLHAESQIYNLSHSWFLRTAADSRNESPIPRAEGIKRKYDKAKERIPLSVPNHIITEWINPGRLKIWYHSPAQTLNLKVWGQMDYALSLFLVMNQADIALYRKQKAGISKGVGIVSFFHAVMCQVISIFFKVLRHHFTFKERRFWRRCCRHVHSTWWRRDKWLLQEANWT